MMQYAHLGRTGPKVSRLAIGTLNFGYFSDESASHEIMDAAIDAGINFFDTADVYGGPQKPDIEKGYGLSKKIIGRWLQQGGRRDKIALATKVYQPMEHGPNDRLLSAYHIRPAARTVCVVSRRITLISTKCITSSGLRRGKRLGRRWRS